MHLCPVCLSVPWYLTSAIHIIFHSIPLNRPQRLGVAYAGSLCGGIEEKGSTLNLLLGTVILENISRHSLPRLKSST